MNRIRATVLAAIAAVVASLFVGLAGSAQAATRNGACESGEFCYSYNSDFAGSVSDHGAQLGDYGSTTPSCYTFRTAGKAGYGQCIKNNAASVWNRTAKTIRVYYNSNYSGKYVDVASGVKRNLAGTALYNQNASHGPKPVTPSLHVPFPCGETWSAQTRTNHSPLYGVDFNHSPDEGWKVYSSAAGTVTTVRDLGNTSYGKYVVITHAGGWQTLYAHLQSFNVSQGQTVTAKSWIGRVGNTGGSFGAHLHYEQKLNGTVVKSRFASGSPVYYGTTSLRRTTACP